MDLDLEKRMVLQSIVQLFTARRDVLLELFKLSHLGVPLTLGQVKLQKHFQSRVERLKTKIEFHAKNYVELAGIETPKTPFEFFAEIFEPLVLKALLLKAAASPDPNFLITKSFDSPEILTFSEAKKLSRVLNLDLLKNVKERRKGRRRFTAPRKISSPHREPLM